MEGRKPVNLGWGSSSKEEGSRRQEGKHKYMSWGGEIRHLPWEEGGHLGEGRDWREEWV